MMSAQVAEARRNAFWRQLVKFVEERIDGTCGDLESGATASADGTIVTVGGRNDNGVEMSRDLRGAYDALRENDFAKCLSLSDRVRASAWDARGAVSAAGDGNQEQQHVYGGSGSSTWPHPCWKEAYVFALLMMSCSSLMMADPDYSAGIYVVHTTMLGNC